jgi:DNA-binding transcriptional ArsR family regulator
LKPQPLDAGLEQVLSSPGRIRLLKLLLEREEANITDLVKRSRLTHTAALQHLKALVNIGLLSEKRFGRIRIFCINEGDQRVVLLRRFFYEWARASNPNPQGRPFF